MKLLLHLNVFQSLFNYTTTLISYLSTAKLMQGNPTLTTKPYTGYQPRHWLQVLTLGPDTGSKKGFLDPDTGDKKVEEQAGK